MLSLNFLWEDKVCCYCCCRFWPHHPHFLWLRCHFRRRVWHFVVTFTFGRWAGAACDEGAGEADHGG
eukprot:1458202-Rhodomonas_salina.7